MSGGMASGKQPMGPRTCGDSSSGGSERVATCVICKDDLTEATEGVVIFTCKRGACSKMEAYCAGCHKKQLRKWTAKVVCPTCRQPSSIKAVDEWVGMSSLPQDDGGVSSQTYTPASHFVRADSAYFSQLATAAEADLAEEKEREASRVKTDRALGKQMMEELSRAFPEFDAQRAKDKEEEDAASQEYIKQLLRNEAGAGASGEEGSCDDAATQALIKQLLQDEAGGGVASDEGGSSRHTAQLDEGPAAGDISDAREQVCSKDSD